MIKKFGIYTNEELSEAQITFGKNVFITNDTIFHNPQNVIIGNNVRIDAQCILIAGENKKIIIGNYVHLGCGCYLFGSYGNIIFNDFSGLSPRCSIYTATDDFTRGHLTNPTISDEFRKVKKGDVIFEKHTGCGAGCVVMPNVTFSYGAGAGALSFVHKNVSAGDIIFGIPAKKILNRNLEKLKQLEEKFIKQL